MGELAFAKALGLEWPARVNTHRELPDVDPFWEVRWDSKLGRVKVATDDKPYMLVAHVTGRPPGFEVHGYINAGWVQQNVPKTDPPDRNGVPRGRYAHFTDIYHLSPINSEFHATCAWINGYGPLEGWICLFCGARRET